MRTWSMASQGGRSLLLGAIALAAGLQGCTSAPDPGPEVRLALAPMGMLRVAAGQPNLDGACSGQRRDARPERRDRQ